LLNNILTLGVHGLCFGVVVCKIDLLFGVLEPPKFVGHFVKSLLEHDCLSDDQNHVSANE